MTRLLAIVSLLIALFVTFNLKAEAQDVPQDIVFEVFRNDQPFGQHSVSFEQDGETLRARTEIELKVKVGPFTVFRYEHEANETWQDGALVALSAETLKDGEITRFDYDRNREDIARMMDQLLPSTHWRSYDLSTSEILNTETGEALGVTLTDLGWETIQTGSGEVEARRVRMVGNLTVDLWYDAAGNWVGCLFEARGQTVRYQRV